MSVFSKLMNAPQFTWQVNEGFNNPLNALSVHKFQRVLITPGKQFMFAEEQHRKEVSISACRAGGLQFESHPSTKFSLVILPRQKTRSDTF